MYNPENKETQLIQNLRLFESMNGLTHEDLADILGMSKSTINSWFCRGTTPDPKAQKALEKVFGVKFDRICSRAITMKLSIDTSLTAEDVYPYNVFIAATMPDEDTCDEDEPFHYRDLTLNDCKDIFSHLTDRENRVLELRFRDSLTYDEVSHKLGVTRERVRQIEHKALRKSGRMVSYHIKVKNDMLALKDKYDELCTYTAKLEQEHYGQMTHYSPNLETPIEDLDFTVRTYNCLKRAGINTLRALIAYDKGFLNIRNLGRRSFMEIADKVNSMNIGYEMNVEYGVFSEVKIKC